MVSRSRRSADTLAAGEACNEGVSLPVLAAEMKLASDRSGSSFRLRLKTDNSHILDDLRLVADCVA
jgi:hypothetical protein